MPVLLFDADCLVCSCAVSFILNWERAPTLHFAPLNSLLGQELTRVEHSARPESVVLYESGRFYQKSDAVLRLAQYLKWPLSSAWVLRIIPVRIRDSLYDVVARNRIRWFGSTSACLLTTPSERYRFLSATSLAHLPTLSRPAPELK